MREKRLLREKEGQRLTPLKIKLHNFRTLSDTELDLSAISLASVVAKNGSGKSSLLTLAPFFALFGKYPGGSIDDLVRTGTQDMGVDYDFEHNGEIYQIIRTRKLGKKSTCEFQRKIATVWESLTGATIKETDAKIQALLNIDADTFLASSLILQGDVSNFSRKLPSERKAVLTSILGLDIYSTLQEQAKAKAKALELKLEGNKQELERLSNSLEKLPDIDTDLALINQQITLKAVDIKAKETELADIQTEIKALEAKEQEAKQIQSQIDGLKNEISVKKAEIISLENRIDNDQAILQSEPEIMQKIAELNELRQQMPALEVKVTRLTELQAQLDNLEEEESKLIDEENALAHKILNLESELSIKPELQQAVEQYKQATDNLKTYTLKAEENQKLNDELVVAEKELLQASVYLDGLLNEYNQLQKKTELLADSNCIDSTKANCKFLQDAIHAKEIMPQTQAEIEQSRLELIPYSDRKQDIIKSIATLAYDKKYHSELKTKVETLQKSVDRYNSLAGKEELLATVTAQKERITERIDQLTGKSMNLQDDISALINATSSLPSLKAKVSELEPFEKQAEKLPQIKANIEVTKEAISKLRAEIVERQFTISSLHREHEQLTSILTNPEEGFGHTIHSAESFADIIHTELKELQANLNALFAQQGALKTRHDLLLSEQCKHAEISQIIAPQAKELSRWETLVKAFSKNGIPVLIIENALPELERIANEILDQMSNGQHSLQFITQRDAKSKDSTIETLDILVRDWAGTRSFESFSGGEQTRISLAIRFALSELLATRAGSKVEFIVGDEILSDQSPEFREMTIEAIKSMAGRFKKILVISHIPEIQGAFDQQITINEGGQVEVKFN